MIEPGQVRRWSADHGRDGRFGVFLVLLQLKRSKRWFWRCLLIDGNEVPGFGQATPGETVLISVDDLDTSKRIL